MSDGRSASRARHRTAIVAAAASLIEETGGLHVTIDALADRVALSRRTVFNYSSSVDDIVTEVFSDVIGAVVESYQQLDRAGDDRTAIFDEHSAGGRLSG